MNPNAKTKIMTMLIVILTNNSYASIATQKNDFQFCSDNYNFRHFTKKIAGRKNTTHTYINTDTEIGCNICFCETFNFVINDEKNHHKIRSSFITTNLNNTLFFDIDLLSAYFSETTTPSWELNDHEYLLKNISIETLARYLFRKEYKLYPTKKGNTPKNITHTTMIYLPNNFPHIKDKNMFSYMDINICKCLGKNKPNEQAINRQPSNKYIFNNAITKLELDKNTLRKNNNYRDLYFLAITHASLNLNDLPVANDRSLNTSTILNAYPRPLTPVSLPPSVWLFASAFIGMASVARRKNK